MLLHLARISVITIALALVGGLGYLLARPAAPTVITVVVPQAPAVATPAPAVQHVHHAYHPWWWSYGPTWFDCAGRVCWR